MLQEMHSSRKSRPLVPLGIKGENAVAGDHLALFYDTEEEFTNALGFIETGLNGTDHCIVFGISSDTERMLRVLSDRHWNVARLMREGRLSIFDPKQPAMLRWPRYHVTLRRSWVMVQPSSDS